MIPDRLRDVIDWFWPSAADVPPPLERPLPVSTAIRALHTDLDLASARLVVETAIDAEEDRKTSVETRLSTMLGQATLSSGIILGVAAVILSDNIERYRLSSVLPVLLCALLSAANVVCAIRAAVHGLSRRAYLQPSITELLEPHRPEREQLEDAVDRLADHQWHNNAKMTQLAISHRAMQNALGYLLIGGALCVALRALDLARQS